MITVNAIMKVNPDKREQYLELVSPLIEAANKEEGSLYYEHFEKTDEPNTFAMIERYKDEEAAQAHNNSDHFKHFFANVPQLLVAEPDITISTSK